MWSLLPLTLCLLSGTTILAAPVDTACTADLLKPYTDAYIQAQTSGKPTPLTALSTTAPAYTEDFRTATLSTGILSKALTIAHNRSTYDTTNCATYTELIVLQPTQYVLGTQIHYTASAAGISKIDTVITKSGDWQFNATATLHYASGENWGTIPVAKRDTRAVIQAAADAYLDVFKNKSVVVPWGTPCDRLEGGSYTGTGSATDSCNVGIPNNIDLTNRRYVLDETLGEVDVFLNFGGTSGLVDSHEFRIESGKIRYVHTLTVMK